MDTYTCTFVSLLGGKGGEKTFKYGRIISLRVDACVHKISLCPPLFNEELALIQESDQSCICVLGVRGHVFVH